MSMVAVPPLTLAPPDAGWLGPVAFDDAPLLHAARTAAAATHPKSPDMRRIGRFTVASLLTLVLRTELY
jgi:hypothetical protein